MELADEILEVTRELINTVEAESEAVQSGMVDGRNALSQKKLDLSESFEALKAKVKANPSVLLKIESAKHEEMISAIVNLRMVSKTNANLLQNEMDDVNAKNSMDGDEILAHLMGSVG